jgi:hypothetical protein
MGHQSMAMHSIASEVSGLLLYGQGLFIAMAEGAIIIYSTDKDIHSHATLWGKSFSTSKK